MKISKPWIRVCNIAATVLLIALFAVQWLPFWGLPTCSCIEQDKACEKPNLLGNHFTNEECEACQIYYKWCYKVEPTKKNPNPIDHTKTVYVSIQQYTWTPTFNACAGTTEYFGSIFNTEDYTFMCKDIVLMPVMVLGLGAAALYLIIKGAKSPLIAFLPLVASGYAVFTYATAPIYQMGNLWQLHLILAIASVLFSLVNVYECIRRAVIWLDPRRS